MNYLKSELSLSTTKLLADILVKFNYADDTTVKFLIENCDNLLWDGVLS